MIGIRASAMTRALVRCAAALAASGCTAASATLGPDGKPIDDHELVAARARWAAMHPTAYSYSETPECDCSTPALRLTVVSATIVAAVELDNRAPVPAISLAGLATIDGLFDILQDGFDRRAASIDMRFDPALGYPTHYFIDYDRREFDEERGLDITDFVIDEPSPAGPRDPRVRPARGRSFRVPSKRRPHS
jgi:hypothetical protein